MTPPAEDTDGYWKVLAPYWETIDIYDGAETFLATYAAAPQVPRALFAAHFCESEVSNGGFHQFFSNATGVLAPEAVEAFRLIGLTESAALITRAMEFFGQPYPREREERIERLGAVTGEAREQCDPFLHLDDEFYRTLGPSHAPFYEALDALARTGEGAV
jgi:hypothetical protein